MDRQYCIKKLFTKMGRAISPTRKIKIFLVLVGICAIGCHILNYRELKDNKSYNKKVPMNLQYVVVHFDFKGAPPKLVYLRSILPKLLDYDVNALLFEYEDMFPYEGKLANLSAKNCYGRNELKEFINFTIQLGFEVIPFVQTFGHLEFALKLEEFRHLREHPDYPDSICPSKEESKDLVSNMLEQVVTFHASISPLKHIHVGCDEVFVMNECRLCKSKQLRDQEIYINFVRNISSVIRNMNPDITVLIWDDMFRKISPISWVGIDYFPNIEPVNWQYGKLDRFHYVHFMNYEKKFKNKWAATAFKGADGNTAIIPNITQRLFNHYSWMKQLQAFSKNKAVSPFKGIILTGWSRYSHMEPICELLPVAIPSLLLNLETVNFFRSGGDYTTENIEEFYTKHLRNNFSSDSLSQYSYTFCVLKEKVLCKLLHDYENFMKHVYSFLQTDKIFAFKYYCHSKMSLRSALIKYIAKFDNSLNSLHYLDKEIANAMKVYYEANVIKEYIEYKTYYLQRELKDLIHTFKACLINNVTLERGPIF